MRPVRGSLLVVVVAGLGGASLVAAAVAQAPSSTAKLAAAVPASPPAAARTPIQHVVVILQENHSFDNVLGGICITDHLSCNGTITGKLHDNTVINLSQAPDIVPPVKHSSIDQNTSINLGQMNGFDQIGGCQQRRGYACYSQYTGAMIPNLKRLAESYVIADNTFSADPVPSWGAHMELIAGQLDGYLGDIPVPNLNVHHRQGWGCDSNMDTPWRNPASGYPDYVMVPSCVPRSDGFGPYRSSPVDYIPTILDRLDGASLSWKLYNDTTFGLTSGYVWSICPTFAECLYDVKNHNNPNPNWVNRTRFATDAAAGMLPAYSVISPDATNSQHNGESMLQGDNYIQSFVNDVMTGPSAQWQSTVFFIVYDDCGCFYDHVSPPPHSGLGIRVPMVIVSPQAVAASVDDHLASYEDSILAFVEQNWGLAPLGRRDASAYDYCQSFVFTTLPCTGGVSAATPRSHHPGPMRIPLGPSPVPAASTQYVATHPPDPNDPT